MRAAHSRPWLKRAWRQFPRPSDEYGRPGRGAGHIRAVRRFSLPDADSRGRIKLLVSSNRPAAGRPGRRQPIRLHNPREGGSVSHYKSNLRDIEFNLFE
ncbi:MAG: acyl-CoA dehydrogenase N-terminal domain-containing protein, partial [Nocardioidaceae bacterium]|nr:acyl-CoA dehydrogenase N-terminal domain-containing protein [Nocardioidaceae bacterium]